MKDVIVELTMLIAQAETDVVERQLLQPVLPGERVLGALDLQGRAIFAAEQVARLALRVYVQNHGARMENDKLIVSRDTSDEWLKDYVLLKTKYELLHALLAFLLARILQGGNLARVVEIRKGYVIVDTSANPKNSELLAQAEYLAKEGDLKPQ